MELDDVTENLNYEETSHSCLLLSQFMSEFVYLGLDVRLGINGKFIFPLGH